jgi:maltose O-acetyltransferase
VKYIAEACGRDVIIKKGCYFGSGVGLRVGSRSQLGQNATIGRCVTFGADVVMGPDVVIMTDAHNFDDLTKPINQQGNVGVRPVVIGDDVWIGTRVIIMPGVKVGSKAVIGAGTVVTRDVPDRAVFAGVPGKVLRYRGKKALPTE